MMKRGALATVVAAAVLAAAVIYLQPTADQMVQWMVYGAAAASTLFTVLYGFTVPWWQTSIGRALLVSSAALALLLDLSVAYQVFGQNYLARDFIRVSIMVAIFVGTLLKLGALLDEKWAAYKARRRR